VTLAVARSSFDKPAARSASNTFDIFCALSCSAAWAESACVCTPSVTIASSGCDVTVAVPVTVIERWEDTGATSVAVASLGCASDGACIASTTPASSPAASHPIRFMVGLLSAR
jgi:hypothetical protein